MSYTRLSTEAQEATVCDIPNLIYGNMTELASAPIYDRFTAFALALPASPYQR